MRIRTFDTAMREKNILPLFLGSAHQAFECPNFLAKGTSNGEGILVSSAASLTKTAEDDERPEVELDRVMRGDVGVRVFASLAVQRLHQEELHLPPIQQFMLFEAPCLEVDRKVLRGVERLDVEVMRRGDESLLLGKHGIGTDLPEEGGAGTVERVSALAPDRRLWVGRCSSLAGDVEISGDVRKRFCFVGRVAGRRQLRARCP